MARYCIYMTATQTPGPEVLPATSAHSGRKEGLMALTIAAQVALDALTADARLTAVTVEVDGTAVEFTRESAIGTLAMKGE